MIGNRLLTLLDRFHTVSREVANPTESLRFDDLSCPDDIKQDTGLVWADFSATPGLNRESAGAEVLKAISQACPETIREDGSFTGGVEVARSEKNESIIITLPGTMLKKVKGWVIDSSKKKPATAEPS